MRKFLVGVLMLLFSALPILAQKAILRGNVSDENTGETIIGASVVLEGTTMGAMTDFDGNYEIKNIPEGNYTVRCSFISYQPQAKENISIQATTNNSVSFKLGEAVVEVGEVKVVAKVSRETEAILLLEQKNAEGIKESIGARRLSSLGVSDAAAATTKISGVTKNEGSGDVYIRGLGDRYLTTTMNGLPIPSDDVEKKNINLTVFSTDVIKNISINKTFDVSTYADQSSGAVNINSKSFSNKFEFGLKTGTNTNILQNNLFGSFKASQNKSNVIAGFYNRSVAFENVLQNQSWNTVSTSLPINRNFSVMGGKKFKLFYRDLSVFATVSHESEYAYSKGMYKKYRGYVLNNSFTDLEKFETTVNTTGLVNLGYDLNKKSSINYYSLFVNKSNDELFEQGRNGEGYYYDIIPQETQSFMRDQNLKQTFIFVNQLLGTHALNEVNNLKWAVGYNMVNANEPNRIRNQVIMLEEDNIYFVRSTYFEQSKSFQNILDGELNGYVKDELKLIDEDQKKLKFTSGINARHKSRGFNSQKIAVVVPKTISGTSIDHLSEVLNNETYYNDGSLIPKIAAVDSYDATLNVYAGYVNASFELTAFSGNVGLRFERDEINIEWDVANYVGRKGKLENDYNNLLPSVNLKYAINEKNSFRFAASKTVTLPEFKELAPFEYVSPTGQVTKGNPELVSSVNYNLDLKWELFPSTKELISLSGFYKLINDPINLAQSRGSSGNFYYANTGEKANVYGLEFETKFELIKSSTSGKPNLNWSMNATKMWFKQDLLEYFQYNGFTESGLQGAAEFITNGSLIYSTNTENELVATVTGNYSSDKILALGAPESQTNRDIYFNSAIVEKGFTALDVIVSKKFSEKMSLKITGKNLLNPAIEQTQNIVQLDGTASDEVVRSYRKGVHMSISLTIKLN